MNPQDPGYITDVVYTDNYYEQLGPVTINYVAALNGIQPRDLTDFDYCEVGCGQGLSLLVHAAAHPQGRFVGIDLNAEHIRRASTRANAAGIDNLKLIAEPVTDALTDSGLPDFDFIVLHGVYSYLPESARQAVLHFIDRRLKTGGVVLISYNALPGWAARMPLRTIMREFALPRAQGSLERVELGLSYLRLMLNAGVPMFQLHPELRKYAESLFELDRRYIAHEFFHDIQNAYPVDAVAAEMSNRGLSFAGTLPLWQNHVEADVPERLTAFFAEFPDRIAREVHKDFIYNTVFRTDLYVREDPAHPDPARARALWNMPFRAADGAPPAERSVRRGNLDVPLDTAQGLTLIGLLAGHSRTLSDLHGHPGLSALAAEDLVTTLCWWVLSGRVRPVAPPVPEPVSTAAARLNQVLLAEAFQQPDAAETWLVSPRFGCAFAFDKSRSLALCALTADDGTTGVTPGARLSALMTRCGLHLEDEGHPLPPDRVEQLARDLQDELRTNGTFDQARQLGILA